MVDVKLLRDVHIKTGVLKRYIKEYQYYKTEVQKHVEKQKTMKEDASTDEYALKKHGELLQESRSLLTLADGNVSKSRDTLKQLVDANAAELEGTEQLTAAEEQIAAAAAIE